MIYIPYYMNNLKYIEIIKTFDVHLSYKDRKYAYLENESNFQKSICNISSTRLCEHDIIKARKAKRQ